jgi:hypothetical protein
MGEAIEFATLNCCNFCSLSKNKSNKQFFCSICQLEDDSNYVILKCKHQFHHLCLLQWLHYNKFYCPKYVLTFFIYEFSCKKKIVVDPNQCKMWSVKNLGLSCEVQNEILKRQGEW